VTSILVEIDVESGEVEVMVELGSSLGTRGAEANRVGCFQYSAREVDGESVFFTIVNLERQRVILDTKG
jgi:hypothetical protein